MRLDEEKKRSAEKHVSRRKITQHQEPLYFHVMRETIREYEAKFEDDSAITATNKMWSTDGHIGGGDDGCGRSPRKSLR